MDNKDFLPEKDQQIARLNAELVDQVKAGFELSKLVGEKDEFIARIQNAAQGMMILSSGQEKMINLIEKERDRYRLGLERMKNLLFYTPFTFSAVKACKGIIDEMLRTAAQECQHEFITLYKSIEAPAKCKKCGLVKP